MGLSTKLLYGSSVFLWILHIRVQKMPIESLVEIAEAVIWPLETQLAACP